jgi:hypothetical protein
LVTRVADAKSNMVYILSSTVGHGEQGVEGGGLIKAHVTGVKPRDSSNSTSMSRAAWRTRMTSMPAAMGRYTGDELRGTATTPCEEFRCKGLQGARHLVSANQCLHALSDVASASIAVH